MRTNFWRLEGRWKIPECLMNLEASFVFYSLSLYSSVLNAFLRRIYGRCRNSSPNALVRFYSHDGSKTMRSVANVSIPNSLNFLRMAAYSDHYRPIAPEWKDSKHTFDLHLGKYSPYITSFICNRWSQTFQDHCIEMLRINLLCRPDGGIIPLRWVENYPRPLPDFSTMHKCRNWEGVFNWVRKREVVIPKGYEWKSQPWEKIFSRPEWMLPPAWYSSFQLYGIETPILLNSIPVLLAEEKQTDHDIMDYCIDNILQKRKGTTAHYVDCTKKPLEPYVFPYFPKTWHNHLTF